MTAYILTAELGTLSFLLVLSFVYATYLQLEFYFWERQFAASQRESYREMRFSETWR